MRETNAPRRGRGSILIASLLMLPAIALMLGLGNWQVQRLHWKEGLLAQIDARLAAPPEPLPASATWASLKPEDYEYRHVSVSGRLDGGHLATIFRGVGKAGDGQLQPGYWIMGPLLLADGSSVLINLGFVPVEAKEAALRALAAGGEKSLSGVMRAPEERGPFIPADSPAKGAWYTRDPVAIAANLGLPRPAPFSIDADAHAASPGMPAGGATVLDIPNNHLSYAATWFGLAATLAAFYAGFLWRRLRRAGP
jgi:surfeit locus 1 family protein